MYALVCRVCVCIICAGCVSIMCRECVCVCVWCTGYVGSYECRVCVHGMQGMCSFMCVRVCVYGVRACVYSCVCMV